MDSSKSNSVYTVTRNLQQPLSGMKGAVPVHAAAARCRLRAPFKPDMMGQTNLSNSRAVDRRSSADMAINVADSHIALHLQDVT